MEITLYDYLMWVAEKDSNITPELIADNLQIYDKTNRQLMSFYKKHKYAVLRDFKEEYDTGEYRGLGYYDTTITFTMNNVPYKLTEVNGSFLHDNGMAAPTAMAMLRDRAEELKQQYAEAGSQTELMLFADEAMAFIDEFLKLNS